MMRFASVLAFALMLIAVPAFGQIDLSGDWNNVAFEDQADRRNGPGSWTTEMFVEAVYRSLAGQK
jgi:hypothetical protein